MNSTTTRPTAKTANIAENNNITLPVRGTLSSSKRKLKNGGETDYHVLQYWKDRKHVSIYVPPDKVEAVRRGIELRQKLEAIALEKAEAGLHATLNPKPMDKLEKKKTSSASSAKNARAKSPKKPSNSSKG